MKILLYMFVIAFLIMFPSATADTAKQALMLWAANIVPTLFPYMVFSRLLCMSLETIRFPIPALCAVLGLLGGSPSGAAVIASNRHAFSKRALLTLCALCGTISPMFILGSIQAWTGQPAVCCRLLGVHWLSSALCAWAVWVFHPQRPQNSDAYRTQKRSAESSNPIQQSIDAVFQIGGCIILYSVLAGMLGKILQPIPWLQPIIHAMLEISGGVHAILSSAFTPNTKAVLLSTSLGFSGFSILSQNHMLLKPLGISMHRLILFAILRAATSALLMSWTIMRYPFS